MAIVTKGSMKNYFDEEGELSESASFINRGDGSSDKFSERLTRLVRIQQLQRSIVKQNMHNAMSPLSAISGYLELMDMSLEEDASVEQIEQYRRKIEKGITEVNDILWELNTLYEQEQEQELEESFLKVDINWLVRDVFNQLKTNSSRVNFKPTPEPLHINTALYTIKLIIYKLTTYSLKCSAKKDQVNLLLKEEEGMAALEIIFNISEHKATDIRDVLTCKNENEEYQCIKKNALNEGLIASNNLIDQIGGFLRFRMLEKNVGRLCLSLPLS